MSGSVDMVGKMTTTKAALEAIDTGFAELGFAPTELPNLRHSAIRSATWIDRARAITSGATDLPADIDIVAYGSLARFEATEASDLDYLVVDYGDPADTARTDLGLDAADELRAQLQSGVVLNGPGSSGMFGTAQPADSFTNSIGLEADTNRSTSRRVLLLEESVSLHHPHQHENLIGAIAERYLAARVAGTSGVPRFLLNDLARYWRTISVDYQAKTPTGNPYSLRYLKLTISRKFTYAASIAPLFQLSPVADDPEALRKRLVEAYTVPPMVRFAAFVNAAVGDDQVQEAGRAALQIVDEFNGQVASHDWRSQIEEDCKQADPRDGTSFGRTREMGRQLQEHLETIFFSKTYAKAAQRYLVF